MDDDRGDTKLKKALRARIVNEDEVPLNTLSDLLIANGIKDTKNMSRREKEQLSAEYVELIDYTTYLPQRIPLTSTFMKDVVDPVTTVAVPTHMYRLTMRKLLRLSLSQLERQAALMKIDTKDLDEIGMAMHIIVYADDKTDLIPELAHALLSKEIAFAFGVKFRVLARGVSHPSSTLDFVVRPIDMMQTQTLSKEDLLAECENQGIAVNRLENKRQLAVRLVSWWAEHPDTVREPLTTNFAKFLVDRARAATR